MTPARLSTSFRYWRHSCACCGFLHFESFLLSVLSSTSTPPDTRTVAAGQRCRSSTMSSSPHTAQTGFTVSPFRKLCSTVLSHYRTGCPFCLPSALSAVVSLLPSAPTSLLPGRPEGDPSYVLTFPPDMYPQSASPIPSSSSSISHRWETTSLAPTCVCGRRMPLQASAYPNIRGQPQFQKYSFQKFRFRFCVSAVKKLRPLRELPASGADVI